MLQIAEKLALQNGCGCLITGESLGQVASQTLEAIQFTNEVVDLPIFRPLIGLDKEATCEISRKIGAFETSILPYEDCCTVFVAKHPKTHPNRDDIIEAEQNLDIAKTDKIPICQDTGMAVFFVKVGQEVHFVGGDITEAINEAVSSYT